MTDILVHLYASQSIANELIQLPDFQVVSTQESEWKDRPRFGLSEGILVIGLIKGLAELGKVILEIVKILKSVKSDATVSIELPNGTTATIHADSDPRMISQQISKSLRE